jgi:uncharacterized protein YcfL
MNNRILIIALVLVCVILFSRCSDSPTKTEEVNSLENTNIEDSSSCEVNPNQLESVNVNYAMIGFDLQEKELLFILNNSLFDVDVIRLLGEPDKKSDPVIYGWGELEIQRWFYNSKSSSFPPITWDPGKVEYQTWYYDSKGIELGFIRVNETQQIVYSIDFQSPCALKTSKGIGIGSTRSEVLKAYKNEFNPDAYIRGSESIVVGMVYEGLIFTIEHDIVSSIFIGVTQERDIVE